MGKLTDKHIQRLIEWLKSKGYSEKEILEAIEYITRK